MENDELIPYKLSDLLKSKRRGGRLDKVRNRKDKNKRRSNNRTARKSRRHNVRTGHIHGKQ